MTMITILTGEYEATSDPTARAELSFALAELYAEEGQTELSIQWASKCVDAVAEAGTGSVASGRMIQRIGGQVLLPDHIHDGTLRERLAECGVTLPALSPA